MPQQQENSRIKSQNATYSCRSCIIYKDQRADLQYDIIQHRRFYYKNERQRRYINSLGTQKARDDYSVRQGIDVGTVLLQLISLVLDIIVIRPTDPAHSEYSGILQLLYKLLLNAILKLAALVEYTRILRGFQFPLGQARLQSPLTYISSYSLQEYARQSIIIPILLRIQLRDEYIKDYFCTNIKTYMPALLRHLTNVTRLIDIAIIVSAMLVRIFVSIARSNVNLMLNILSAEDRTTFIDEMVAMRQLFQQVNEVAAVASIKNLQSRRASLAPSKRATLVGTPSASVSRSAPSILTILTGVTEALGATIRLLKLRSDQARPNVYIGLYYNQTIYELGNASNANVLISEFKYKEFKDWIYNTNYNNPERNLLRQQSFQIAIRLIVQNGYPNFHNITKKIKDIQKECPKLFNTLLLRLEQSSQKVTEADDLETSYLICPPRYTNVATSKRIQDTYCRDFLALPIRINKVDQGLKQKISGVYRKDYQNNVTLIDSRPVKQQKRAAFNNDATQRRVVLRRSDFVRFKDSSDADDKIGRINQIFTYKSSPSNLRLFFRISPVHKIPYPTQASRPLVDYISLYKIRKIAALAKEVVVRLLGITSRRVYAILYRTQVGSQYLKIVNTNVKLGDNLLFVDQDIQFL